ncbi:MAG: class I SAM-dependent methyltransferase [Thaumarchaeota archaeon]|nr:class I SAM-dependent methyltransferase [Nitrososphaerota archaeon]MCL5318582.1 class I SAM-dependent methyltransferase [Nitrososphaerota archaeon]
MTQTPAERFYEETHKQDQQEYVADNRYIFARKTFLQLGVTRLLDIGCANGEFMTLCVESGIKCSGVEISQLAVQRAKEHGLDVQQLDVDNSDLPFESESFEGVFCSEVIEHLFNPDHLLEESWRVLKSGGFLIVTTPNLSAWFNRIFLLFGYQPVNTAVSTKYAAGQVLTDWVAAGHIRVFTHRALIDLLSKHYSFEVVKVKGLGLNAERLGHGVVFANVVRIMNFLFSRPSFSSGLFVVARKVSAEGNRNG